MRIANLSSFGLAVPLTALAAVITLAACDDNAMNRTAAPSATTGAAAPTQPTDNSTKSSTTRSTVHEPY
jgi:hypothetical protein